MLGVGSGRRRPNGGCSDLRPDPAWDGTGWGTSERQAARPEAPRPLRAPDASASAPRPRLLLPALQKRPTSHPVRPELCRRHRFSPLLLAGKAFFRFKRFLQPISPSGGSPGVPITRTHRCWANFPVYRIPEVVGARCRPRGATGLPPLLRPRPGAHLGEPDLQRPRGCPKHNCALGPRRPGGQEPAGLSFPVASVSPALDGAFSGLDLN